MTDSARNQGIAISRAFEILRSFSPGNPYLSNADMCRITGLPRSTVSRIALTLEELGYLFRVGPNGKYRLGWGAVSLGYPLLTDMHLRQIARPEMLELSTRLKVNVNMGTIHRTSVVYVESVRFNETSATRPDIGAPRALLTSSIGRALIWSLSERERTALLNKLELTYPGQLERVHDRLNDARKSLITSGFCISIGETQSGYTAVSVPMRVTPHEEPIAFNCASLDHREQRARFEDRVGPALVSMVKSLEIRLGTSSSTGL